MESVREEAAPVTAPIDTPQAVVVIGAGAGGVAALSEILPRVPANFPACILVVQQMRPGFTKILARELNDISEIDVEEASDGDPLRSSTALIVPGGKTLKVVRIDGLGTCVRTEDISSGEQNRMRADITMASVAQVFGARALGVILTGIGDDGRNGLKAIRDRGGKTLAQDEASSIVYDAPKAAIEFGVIDEVVPLWNIPDRLIDLIGEEHGSFLPEAAG